MPLCWLQSTCPRCQQSNVIWGEVMRSVAWFLQQVTLRTHLGHIVVKLCHCCKKHTSVQCSCTNDLYETYQLDIQSSSKINAVSLDENTFSDPYFLMGPEFCYVEFLSLNLKGLLPIIRY
jgi:hypothetical protein